MFSMPTPTATMREDFERVERLKEKGATTIYSRANNPDGTGRHHGLLTYMGFYDLLPTPITWDGEKGGARPMDGKTTAYEHKYSASLKDRAAAGLLPTPTAIEGVKWMNTWNPNSQMGQSLSAMAGSGMLPTPKDLLPTPVVMEDRRKIYGEKAEDEHRTEKMMSNLNPYSIEQGMGLENGAITAAKDGKTSRLSPLFTEEMMGFPLMWTALPFLSESGAPKPSKPTATR